MSISEPQPTSGTVKKKKAHNHVIVRSCCAGFLKVIAKYTTCAIFFFFQKPICDEFVQEFQGFFSSIGKCPSLLHTPTARFNRLEAVQEQMINPGNIKRAKE